MRSSSIERTFASERSSSSAIFVDLRLAALRGRVVSGDEQADQRARRVGCAAQRVDDGDETEAAAGLAQVAEPGADPHHRLGIELGVEDELVELVILG